MYTSINFKSKADVKRALAEGKKLTVYQPNDFFGANTQEGKVYLEGPHYPQPHKWYAEIWLENGYIVRIK